MTVEQKMLTPDEVEQALRTGAPLDPGDYIVWYAKGGAEMIRREREHHNRIPRAKANGRAWDGQQRPGMERTELVWCRLPSPQVKTGGVAARIPRMFARRSRPR